MWGLYLRLQRISEGCTACLLWGLLCLASFPGEARPLKQLLYHLEETHPALQAQYEQAKASEATIGEAASGFLPRISFDGTYGYQEQEREGGISSNGIQDADPLSASLSISQNVFEGFRTIAALDGAKASYTAAELGFLATRQEIFSQAIESYVQLMRQWHLVQLSQQNVQTLQNQVQAEQERMVAGTGISVDVLFAQSRLQRAYERYAGFLGDFHEREAAFEQFFGMRPDYSSMRLPSLPPHSLPNSLPQAVQIAVSNNPTLQQTEFQADAAESEKRTARAGYFPRFDVIARSSYNDSGETITGEVSTNTLQLRGSWELFSGFADQSRTERAIHNHQASLASMQNTQRRVVESTQQAWARLVTLRQRAAILQNAAATAQQVYEARKRLRDIGSETALNVLDAENELFSAQINATSAQYQSYLASFQLLAAMGILEIDAII